MFKKTPPSFRKGGEGENIVLNSNINSLVLSAVSRFSLFLIIPLSFLSVIEVHAQKRLTGDPPVAELVPENAEEFEEEETCLSAREFITTMRFLKEKESELALSSEKAQRLAEYVSTGCTGAAQRFITTLNLLLKLEIGARDSVKYASQLSQKTNVHTQVFQIVLKKSYLKKYLDLDLKTSMGFARQLTFEYEGEVENAGKDFEELIDFCLESKEMGLTLSDCGQVAVRMTTYGQGWKKGIREAFKRQYRFSRDELGVSISEALEISDNVLRVSPYAVENFIEAYKYASSDDGLAMPAKEAVVIAQKIAGKTLPKDSERREPRKQRPLRRRSKNSQSKPGQG